MKLLDKIGREFSGYNILESGKRLLDRNRCNAVFTSCPCHRGYCSEYDKFSDPVPAKVLEKRLLKLKELGTFGILLTGGGALTLKNLLTSSFHADQARVP
jgi:hypothetical protein